MKKRLLILFVLVSHLAYGQRETVATEWIELMLQAIQNDEARPTVHARNLHHVSAAIYDAWAVYESSATTYLIGNRIDRFSSTEIRFSTPADKETEQRKAISYAAYRLLSHRFQFSAGALGSLERFSNYMEELGLDAENMATDFSSGDGIAVGNAIADIYINYGLQDGSNEFNNYLNFDYSPANPPLILTGIANPTLIDLNRWQPLAFDIFIDQSGLRGDGVPDFLGADWGDVIPFALSSEDRFKAEDRDGDPVYHDPGIPWMLDENSSTNEQYIWNFSLVANWSSHLDPAQEILWDISPGAIGNNPEFPTDMSKLDEWYDYTEGGEPGMGHSVNPSTGLPYEPNIVKRGDYTRVLAEFWADGPDSETPPGHWVSIARKVLLDENLEYKYKGEGDPIDPLEYQVKLFFTLGGAVHDAAIAAWDIKEEYDYIRPISYIRWASDKQSSNSALDNYDPYGLPIIPGFIEPVLAGDPDFPSRIGQMKIKTWRGPRAIVNPRTDIAGVDWMLAETWWPYQRATFVTPPFAGYISGHSTFSRAAAEVLSAFTGSEFFPGGMGTFSCPRNEFLVFEDGPSTDIELQWATYYDASDQSGLSRIWGGIHPPIDDIPGRLVGQKVGISAFEYAEKHFNGTIEKDPAENTDLMNARVFPNPVASGELLNVEFQGILNDATFRIYDVQGRLHHQSNSSFVSRAMNIYTTEPLSSGIYFLEIESTDTKKMVKFFVN